MYDQMYRESQHRIRDLLTPLTDAELELMVPACPLWSVRDVLAHLVGVSASITDGSGIHPASTEWTHGHVETRRGHTVQQMFDEWAHNTPALIQSPITNVSWLPVLHDTLSHEADLRSAIGAPRLPGDVLVAAYPLLLTAMARRLARFGTVRLELDEHSMDLSSGEPDLVVQTSRFEFWRGAFGRRSPSQLRGWVRHGDAPAFALTLPVFQPRTTDLIESG
jgi:uncharacterized protein (TIGR03083 family)